MHRTVFHVGRGELEVITAEFEHYAAVIVRNPKTREEVIYTFPSRARANAFEQAITGRNDRPDPRDKVFKISTPQPFLEMEISRQTNNERLRRLMTGSPVHFTRPAGEPYSIKERMDSCWKNIVDQHKQQAERLSNPLSEEQEEMNEPFVPMLRPRFVPELIFTETTLFDHNLALFPRVGISPDEEED